MQRPLSLRLIARSVAFILFISFIGIFPLNQRAAAASPYSGKPANLEPLKNKLLDALFVVNYGGKTELAFAGNYTLSQSSKDDGYESNLVTSRYFLENCFYDSISSRTLKLTIENRGKTYKGTCWGYGLEYVDMATIATPFKSPTLPLWDSYMPNPGAWLLAVYHVPGFGITFKETEVGIINKKTYVLGVEKFSPAPTGSALLFNQDGSFVGILTSKGVGTVPSEYFKVHGAPLQCSPASTEENAITGCSTRKSVNESAQDGVWTIDDEVSPTPSPTPSPSISSSPVNDAIDELRDTYQAALEAYRLYLSTVQDCLRAFQIRSSLDRKLLPLVSGTQICLSEDAVNKTNYQKLIGFGQSIDSAKDVSKILDLLDSMNSLTDEFNISMDVITDGVIMADEIREASKDYEKLEEYFLNATEVYEELNGILESIPIKVQKLLSNDRAISEALDTYAEIQFLEDEFTESTDGLGSTTYPDLEVSSNLKILLKQLILKIPTEYALTSGVELALDEIPEFYCQKKKKYLLSKNNKCAKGYTKKTIRG